MAKKNTPANKPEATEDVVMDDPNMVSPEEAQAAESPAEEVEQVEEVQAPKEIPKPSKKFSEDLKATLVKYPHILNVWVNEKGEWYYSNKAGFISYSREEILNG